MTDLTSQSSAPLFNRSELGRLTPEHLPPLLDITAGAAPVSPRGAGRLALAAPGSEAGSGLIELDRLRPPPRRRRPTPPPREQRPARLAVPAPASWGSGVVDVHAYLDEAARRAGTVACGPDPDDGFVYLATRDLEPWEDLELDRDLDLDLEPAEPSVPGKLRSRLVLASTIVAFGVLGLWLI